MEVRTYLNFDGQCEEAFNFYAKTCGGEIVRIERWADMPGECPPGMEQKLMHAHLQLGATAILAADSPPGRYTKPSGFNVTLGVSSAADAERVFNAFLEGGTVTMPFAETFFAHRFGMLTDRFSIPWMILCEREA